MSERPGPDPERLLSSALRAQAAGTGGWDSRATDNAGTAGPSGAHPSRTGKGRERLPVLWVLLFALLLGLVAGVVAGVFTLL